MKFGLTAAICVGLVIPALIAGADDYAQIENRIRELQPKASEKRFDEIGWAKDIRHATKVAAENNRPVFLFTHDGRMNIGRC